MKNTLLLTVAALSASSALQAVDYTVAYRNLTTTPVRIVIITPAQGNYEVMAAATSSGSRVIKGMPTKAQVFDGNTGMLVSNLGAPLFGVIRTITINADAAGLLVTAQ